MALAAITVSGLPTFNPDGASGTPGSSRDGLVIDQDRADKRSHDSIDTHQRLDFHMGRVDDNAKNEMASDSQSSGMREIWDANSLLVGSNYPAGRTGVKIPQDSSRTSSSNGISSIGRLSLEERRKQVSSANGPGSDTHATVQAKREMSKQGNEVTTTDNEGLVRKVRKLLGSLGQTRNQQIDMNQQENQQEVQQENQQQNQQPQNQQHNQQQQSREGAIDTRQAKTEWNMPLDSRSHEEGRVDSIQQDSLRQEISEARILQSRNHVSRSHGNNTAVIPQQQQQSDVMGCLQAAMGDLHK